MNRLIAATAVAGIIFLAGCGTGDGAEQSGGNNESATRLGTSPTTSGPPPTADDQTTTTGPKDLRLKDRPPDSTLSYKDQRVTGTLGSYCWGSVCADVAGIPVPPARDSLTLPAGATLIFDFGGSGTYKVDAAAYPLNTESETLPGPDGVQFLMPRGKQKNVKAIRTSGRTRIIADVPSREYVLSVFVDPGRSDASYSYRLRVEPAPDENSAIPPASEKEVLFARQPSTPSAK